MSAVQQGSGTDRRQFLRRGAATGAGVVAGVSSLGLLAPAFATAKSGGVTSGDVAIVAAAQIAEALAVTTYTNIINKAPFFKHLAGDDKGYLVGARQEEMSHYALEMSVTGKPSPFSTFYYPAKMFSDAHTTLDVLVTLEDAFIAAYLVGVRNFSTPDLRVLAARIMGIESDHRTLARVLGGNVAHKDGGPIEKITGVTYHPGHVWKVLRSMGWSRQRPARKAAERDDEAIEQWVNERWPRVKKTLGPGTHGSSSKTRAGSASSPR